MGKRGGGAGLGKQRGLPSEPSPELLNGGRGYFVRLGSEELGEREVRVISLALVGLGGRPRAVCHGWGLLHGRVGVGSRTMMGMWSWEM